MQRVLTRAGHKVALYSSATEFLESYDGAPACLILDLKMPGMRGERLMSEILERGLNLVVLVLTGHATIPSTVFLTRAGVIDVLEKPIANADLLARVQDMLARAPQIFAHRALAEDFRARMQSLTKREREVFDLLLAGLSSIEIGQELAISKKTIDIHRSRVMSKMGTASVAELIVNWTTLVKNRNGESKPHPAS